VFRTAKLAGSVLKSAAAMHAMSRGACHVSRDIYYTK
jgi:hypothetical protein